MQRQDMVDDFRELLWKAGEGEGGSHAISSDELDGFADNPKLQEMLLKIDVPHCFRVSDVHLMLDRDGDGLLSEEAAFGLAARSSSLAADGHRQASVYSFCCCLLFLFPEKLKRQNKKYTLAAEDSKQRRFSDFQ